MEFQNKVIMAPALTLPNTYFIFRENKEQLTVKVQNDRWFCNRRLTPEETQFINENLLKNG
jgi:hypothetical protein